MKIVLLEPLGINPDMLSKFSAKIKCLGHEFVAYDTVEKDEDVLKSKVKDADVLIIANNPLNGNIIRSAENLKYISIAFTGYDHVDLTACREKSIQVSNARGYATEAVAELTICLIISLLRNLVSCNEVVRKEGTKAGLIGSELNGKTVGIVGTGAIGLRVAEILKAFRCTLLGYSRSQASKAKELGIEYVSLEELLTRSDIVSLHVPLNEETKGLIDKKKIALMKPGAVLINTARGPVVDSTALAEALNSGRLGGAGIDVFESEPPIAADHPLLHARNTVATPHVAFATEESMVKRANIVFDNVESWLKGELKNPVL